MNRTKIEWTDYTWNPLPGCPAPNCSYCYAKRQLRRHIECPDCYAFKPHLHEERLSQPWMRKTPTMIFADSTGDPLKWASDAVMRLWIEVMKSCHWHTFQILTKNPKRYADFDFPENCWLGTTVDKWYSENLDLLKDIDCPNIKFVSFEPLLTGVSGVLKKSIDLIDWVIVGAQTGPGATPPSEKWVQQIIDLCRENEVPVFLKDNLQWHENIQNWPNGRDD